MNDREALRRQLGRIDGRPYGFYRDLRGGHWQLGPATLRVDHVGDHAELATTGVGRC